MSDIGNELASIVANREYISFYEKYQKMPKEVVSHISSFMDYIKLVVHDYTSLEENRQKDPALITAQLLDYYGKNLQLEERNKFFAAFHYDPDDVDSFKQRYHQTTEMPLEQIAENNNSFNGFRAVDVPKEKNELFAIEHSLLNRIKHEDKKDYYLYSLDGKGIFKDYGSSIRMSNSAASGNSEAILAASLMAQRKYGNSYEIIGSNDFIARAIDIMARHGMGVTLKNPSQFSMYQAALGLINDSKADNADMDIKIGGKAIGEKIDTSSAQPISDNFTHAINIESVKSYQKDLMQKISLTENDILDLKQSLKSFSITQEQIYLDAKGNVRQSQSYGVIPHNDAAKDRLAPGVMIADKEAVATLIKGEGNYLQGIAHISGKPHHVIVPLPLYKAADAPILAFSHTQAEKVFRQIGKVGLANENNNMVIKVNLNGALSALQLKGDAKEQLTAFFHIVERIQHKQKDNSIPDSGLSMHLEKPDDKPSQIQSINNASAPMNITDVIVIAQHRESANLIHQYTGHYTVYVNNIDDVEKTAQKLKKDYPQNPIIIAGNNDISNSRPSEFKRVAKAIGAIFVQPPHHVSDNKNQSLAPTTFVDMEKAEHNPRLRFQELFAIEEKPTKKEQKRPKQHHRPSVNA